MWLAKRTDEVYSLSLSLSLSEFWFEITCKWIRIEHQEVPYSSFSLLLVPLSLFLILLLVPTVRVDSFCCCWTFHVQLFVLFSFRFFSSFAFFPQSIFVSSYFTHILIMWHKLKETKGKKWCTAYSTSCQSQLYHQFDVKFTQWRIIFLFFSETTQSNLHTQIEQSRTVN